MQLYLNANKLPKIVETFQIYTIMFNTVKLFAKRELLRVDKSNRITPEAHVISASLQCCCVSV